MIESNTLNLVQAGITSPVNFSMMGMQMLKYHLWDAKSHFRHPTKKTKEKLAFISGTGMKIILETFNIAYDYQRLCEAFFDYFNCST
jgi:hypothetical protein